MIEPSFRDDLRFLFLLLLFFLLLKFPSCCLWVASLRGPRHTMADVLTLYKAPILFQHGNFRLIASVIETGSFTAPKQCMNLIKSCVRLPTVFPFSQDVESVEQKRGKVCA